VTLVQGETILRFNVPLTIKNIETVFGVSWSEFFRNFKDIIRPSNYSLHGKLYVRILGIRYTHEVNEKFVYS
jgi:hypothetical protein